MTRFARLALSLAVIAAPAFLYGCTSEEPTKPADSTPAAAPKDGAKDTAKPTPTPAPAPTQPDVRHPVDDVPAAKPTPTPAPAPAK